MHHNGYVRAAAHYPFTVPRNASSQDCAFVHHAHEPLLP